MSGNVREQDCGWVGGDEVFWVFERQVLVFPLLVVFLACVSFLFGGRCAAWQWWTAVAVVVGVPFLKKGGWRAALAAAGMFAGLLLAVKCLLPPVLWDNVGPCEDMQVYHLPQIQLLIEGWNPVEDPLAEGICAKLGLDLWGMAPLHVAFLPKTMAVFAAVAYTFVGDPTGLTIPGLAFLWLGVALQAMRQFRGLVRLAALAALAWVLPRLDFGMFVDLSLAFASCGLLLAMTEALKHRRCSWVRLGVWTAWMVTIKLNGVLAATVFWGVFAGLTVWRERGCRGQYLWRFALLGTAVAAVCLVVVWHPYGTSWRKYGHPLYPFSTVDAAEHPVKDLTWDLRPGNEDYRQMGRAGLWIHEYISPRLTAAFYNRKLGRTDFAPKHLAMPFRQWVEPGERVTLWLLFAVLLLHLRGRPWGWGGLLLTGLVPKESIGYLRYSPWLTALGCLAIVLVTESVETKVGKKWNRLARCCLVAALCIAGFFWVGKHARDVEFKAVELDLRREQIRTRFFVDYRDPEVGVAPGDFVARYDYLSCLENQCRLLACQMGRGAAEILPAVGWQAPGNKEIFARRPMWKWDERQWFDPEGEKDWRCIGEAGAPWHDANVWDGPDDGREGEAWLMTPWYLYYVPYDGNAQHLVAYWRGGEPREGEGRLQHLLRRMAWVARTWCWIYPREAWRWLRGTALTR